jgi:hypothetical protein
MWRLFRYRPDPSDREGIEKAKAALSMAKQIEHHATVSERQHREILRRNNLGPKIHRALGGK